MKKRFSSIGGSIKTLAPVILFISMMIFALNSDAKKKAQQSVIPALTNTNNSLNSQTGDDAAEQLDDKGKRMRTVRAAEFVQLKVLFVNERADMNAIARDSSKSVAARQEAIQRVKDTYAGKLKMIFLKRRAERQAIRSEHSGR